MKRKYKDFLILLSIFFVFLFRNSINEIITIVSHNFNFANANIYINTALAEENNALKEMLDFKNDITYDFEISRVKYRDVLEFSDSFQIFKGKKQGIEKGMAVINEKGLVGTISYVDKATSKVELIINKNSNISVKMNDVYGILKYRDNKLIVSDIASRGIINVGDEIYTSGLGNLPGDIYIGKVEEVLMDDLGIEQTAIVSPAVDFNKVSYLVVVMQK